MSWCMSGRRHFDRKAEAGDTTEAPAALRAVARLLARQAAREEANDAGAVATSSDNAGNKQHHQSAASRLDGRGDDES